MALRTVVLANMQGVYMDCVFDDVTLAVDHFSYENLGGQPATVTIRMQGRADTVRNLPAGTARATFSPPNGWGVGVVVNPNTASGFAGNGWSIAVTVG
jgi:hypothetical protein